MTPDEAAEIPEHARHLLENPNFASLATVMQDGWPQVSTVWVHLEDGAVVFNTSQDRLKAQNLGVDERVAIAVHNEEDPYEQLQIKGRAEVIPDEGHEHIDRLARKYTGGDFPRYPGQVRVKVRVVPEKVTYTRND
jgi:PPOX class probable F420-dependent enzyme